MPKDKVDNPDKTPEQKGADTGKPDEGTQPEYPDWLDEKFIKGSSNVNEAIEKAARSQSEAEKRMHQLEAEVHKLKTGGAETIREALAEKEDEIEMLRTQIEEAKKPKAPTATPDQEAQIRDWHSRLMSDDPIVAARAAQEAIVGEIYRYDQAKRAEEAQRDLEAQFEKVDRNVSKEEIEELMPYIVKIKKERPDLAKGRHAVEDIIDKARARLQQDKEEIELEEELKKAEKEKSQTSQPSATPEPAGPVELSQEEIDKLSPAELEKLINEQGIKTV